MPETRRAQATAKNRGAPTGNQNARKHGFYSTNLDAAGKRDYRVAVEVEGLDPELAMLSVKLHRLATYWPHRQDMLLAGVHAVGKLVRDREITAQTASRPVSLAICRMLTEAAEAAGLDIVALPPEPDTDRGVDGETQEQDTRIQPGTIESWAGNKGKQTETKGNQAQSPDPPRSDCLSKNAVTPETQQTQFPPAPQGGLHTTPAILDKDGFCIGK